MEGTVTRLESVLLVVDASATKFGGQRAIDYARAFPGALSAVFLGNLVYWPMRWCGIDHRTKIWVIVAAMFYWLICLLFYSNKFKVLAQNYYSYYNRFVYILFIVLVIAFAIGDVMYVV